MIGVVLDVCRVDGAHTTGFGRKRRSCLLAAFEQPDATGIIPVVMLKQARGKYAFSDNLTTHSRYYWKQ